MRGKKMKDVKDEKNEREGINYEEREVQQRMLNKCHKKKIFNKDRNEFNCCNQCELLLENNENEEDEGRHVVEHE